MMEEQRTILLTERQEALARALRSFPQEPDGALEAAWPEGHGLYRALQGLKNRKNRKNILDVPGRFLYSDISTLRPGDYYFLGTSPYFDQRRNPSLRAEIQEWSGKCTNAYLDEAWDTWDDHGRTFYVGRHHIQKRVQELFDAIVGDGPDASVRQVCSSHLIFRRSKNENAQLADAKDFLPVHQAVLHIVKPACVLVMGTKEGGAFEKAKKLLRFDKKEEFYSGVQNWRCKVAVARDKEGPRLLIGVPHFTMKQFIQRGLGSDALKRIVKLCRAAAGR
jgi:hypothetical protein